MGVNFPDVRYIIHWGPAGNILDYHQESGLEGGSTNLPKCWPFITSNKSLSVKMMSKPSWKLKVDTGLRHTSLLTRELFQLSHHMIAAETVWEHAHPQTINVQQYHLPLNNNKLIVFHNRHQDSQYCHLTKQTRNKHLRACPQGVQGIFGNCQKRSHLKLCLVNGSHEQVLKLTLLCLPKLMWSCDN